MRIAFMSGEKKVVSDRSGMPFARLSSELAALGYDVTVYDVASDRRNDPADATARIRTMTFFRARSVSLRTLLSTLHAIVGGYDVVHADSHVPIPYLFLFRAFRRRSCVVVSFSDDSEPHGLRMSLIGWIADRIVHEDGEWFDHATGPRGDSATHIREGVDERSVKTTALIRSLGLKEKRFALSSTRDAGHEDIRCLVKVFQYLENTGKLPNNFRLAIMGSRAETAGYGRYLRAMNERHGNILFLGECPDGDRDELLSHAAVFVQPSEGSRSSGELLAAMSAGLPVIAGDSRENREVLGSSGILFTIGDFMALRAALAYLLNRPDEMRLHGELSRRRIRDRFSWERMARQTAEIYEEAIRERLCREYGIQRNNHHA